MNNTNLVSRPFIRVAFNRIIMPINSPLPNVWLNPPENTALIHINYSLQRFSAAGTVVVVVADNRTEKYSNLALALALALASASALALDRIALAYLASSCQVAAIVVPEPATAVALIVATVAALVAAILVALVVAIAAALVVADHDDVP